MKKSILIVIGVIYILSIVAVSFYGLKIQNYHENKYPDSIALLNQTDKENGIIVYNDSQLGIIMIVVDYSITKSIKLEYELSRIDNEEVTAKELDYFLDNATVSSDEISNEYCSIDSDGTVTFTGLTGGTNLLIRSSAKESVELKIQFVIKQN